MLGCSNLVQDLANTIIILYYLMIVHHLLPFDNRTSKDNACEANNLEELVLQDEADKSAKILLLRACSFKVLLKLAACKTKKLNINKFEFNTV